MEILFIKQIKNLYEEMVSYQDRREEMIHNFQFLYKSLNHDENVLNEYIIPIRHIFILNKISPSQLSYTS
jgi:hypothetical protein